MSDATITISCLICGDELKSGDVQAALAFDRAHNETCKPKGGAA